MKILSRLTACREPIIWIHSNLVSDIDAGEEKFKRLHFIKPDAKALHIGSPLCLVLRRSVSVNIMTDKGPSLASNYTAKQPYQHSRFPVVILGSGESGIAVGCLLKKKHGLSDFKIFDRQGGIEGAW